jgi:lysophospholipase L1-like esterase
MRAPIATLYLVLAVLPVAASAVAARRHGVARAGLLLAADVGLGCVAVLTYPAYRAYYPDRAQSWLFVAAVVGIVLVVNALGVFASPARAASAVAVFGQRRWLQRGALAGLAALATLAALEALATAAVMIGVAEPYVPTETRLAGGTEDWRLVHVMSDDYREPDPVLLWRPVPRSPYGRQRFRGPDVAVPKPDGVTRLMCYGDSNTDGPLAGNAWPAQLGRLLGGDGGAREVINAGVAGYSSYQGLQRLREEVEDYEPDVVLVSFGWNDAANAIGPPDSAFASSSGFRSLDPGLVWLRRLLLKYQAYLVARRYLAAPPVESSDPTSFVSRVAVGEYESNLRTFVATARAHGATPVLLTRPHLASSETLEQGPGWRRLVPSYNRAVLDVAQSTGALAVDVQRAFAGRPELFADECHFNEEGHAEMARLLADELGRAGVIDRHAKGLRTGD